jgi:hypothetical protein
MIICALAAFAAFANLRADIVRDPYSGMEKRAHIENRGLPSTSPKSPSFDRKAESPAQNGNPATEEVAGKDVNSISPTTGIGQWLRDVAHGIARDTERAAIFLITWKISSDDYVEASARDPYLPSAGSANVRFGTNAPFDRTHNFGLAAYNRLLETRRAADEAANAEKSRRLAAAEAAKKVEQSESTPAPQPPAGKNETLSARAGEKAPAKEEINSLQNREINTEVLLHYFDTGKDKGDVKSDVTFVMPYQSTPPPLVMESKATYTETKNATEGSKSAK